MILTLVKQSALIIAAIFVVHRLSVRLSIQNAFVVWGSITMLGVALGTWALATSTTGKITWKNYFASYVIPWGWRLNYGKLWPIPIISWTVWMMIAVATLLVLSDDSPQKPVGGLGFHWVSGMLLSSWIVITAAMIYLVGTLIQNFSVGSASGQNLLMLIGVLATMLIASVCLHFNGATHWAIVVAGGPIALISGAYGIFVAFILVFGRNTRWN